MYTELSINDAELSSLCEGRGGLDNVEAFHFSSKEKNFFKVFFLYYKKY